MKPILKLLAAVITIVAATGSTSAAEWRLYQVPTRTAEASLVSTNNNHRSMAASDTRIYIGNNAGATYYVRLGNNTALNEKNATSYNQLTSDAANPYCVVADDAGNLITAAPTSTWYNAGGRRIAIFGKSPTANSTPKMVEIGTIDGRSDRFAATGDLLNGTGYIWFAPSGKSYLQRFKFVKGVKQSGSDKFNITDDGGKAIANGSPVYLKFINSTEAFYGTNGKGYVVTVNEAAKTVKVNSTENEAIQSKASITRKYIDGVMFEAKSAGNGGLVTLTAGDIVHTVDMGNINTTGSGRLYSTVLTDIVEEGNFVSVYIFNAVRARKYIWTKDNMTIGEEADDTRYADFTVLPVTGATAYAVYKKNGNKWNKIVDGNDKTLKYRVQLPKDGAESEYRVVYSTDGSFSPTANVVCDYKVPGVPVPVEYRAPINFRGRRHSGYCQYELTWNTPENTPSKPLYYNIYRDGALLKRKVTFTSYLDPNVAPGQHTYSVEAVYEYTEDADGNVTSESIKRMSEPIVTPIDPRDHSRIKYNIREIYNLRIGQAHAHFSNPAGQYIGEGTNTPDIENIAKDNWRHAAHAIVDGKGYWYCFDKGSSCIRRVEDTVEALTNNVKFGEHVVTLPTVNQAVAVAVDDAGNLLVRTGNAFYGPLHKAYIIPKGSKAFDSTWKEVVFDAKTGAGNMFYDDSYNYPAASNGIGQRGRVDFFSVKGNLMSNDVCHVVFAGGQGRTAYCANIQNGNLLEIDKHQLDDIYENLDVEGGIPHEVGNGTENYAFFRDGDVKNNVFLHQVRSSGYFRVSNIHGTAKPGSPAWDDQVILREGQSNQAGGCTVFFRGTHANGVSCADLFIITGVSSYSVAMGSFTVNRASRVPGYETIPVLDTNSDMFDLTNLIPTATFIQREAAIASEARNSNSNFLYSSVVGEKDGKHIYIYQYVPNRRVAKYELIPQIELPVPAITIDAFKVYKTDENGKKNIDITDFKGTMSWKAVDFDKEDKGNYKVMGYNVEIVSESGKKYEFHTDSRLSEKDGVLGYNYTVTYPDGTVKTGFQPVDNTDGKYKAGQYVQDFEIPFDIEELGEYKATITADVAPSTDPESIIKTSPASSNSSVSLEVEDPRVTADVWKGREGSDVDGKYRVDIDFDHNNNDNENPVSYYEIWVDKHDGNGPQKITVGDDGKGGFYVIDGGTPGDGDRPADRIPGNYDFNNSKDYATPDAQGEGGKPSVITWYPEVKPGEDPSTWDYYVKPVYASETRHRTVTEGKATVKTGTTSVEFIGADGVARLSVYPNPAVSAVTVESNDVIETVSVYSATGAEVLTLRGDGTTTMTVDVDSLTPGIYYFRINGLPAVKVIKM